jgi:hypothetical protein
MGKTATNLVDEGFRISLVENDYSHEEKSHDLKTCYPLIE